MNDKEHLKHILYNNCHVIDVNGMNHNAMDRWGCYEVFLGDIRQPDYAVTYNRRQDQYQKTKDSRQQNNSSTPYYDWVEEYAQETTDRVYNYLINRRKLANNL